MKKISLLSCLLFLIFFSCSSVDDIPAQEEKIKIEGTGHDLLMGMGDRSFKKDFIAYNPYGKEMPEGRSYLIFNHLKKASGAYKEKDKHYPEIKQEINALNTSEERKFHSVAIQSIALRYLRYYFLKEDSPVAIQETIYLLDLLVEHQAIDLDVLVDAFLKVEEVISEEDRSRYYDHIVVVYNQSKASVNENALKLKELYENSEGQLKMEALLSGKLLEQKSRSIAYAEEKMNLQSRQ
ncbi:MAG TPA: hypothetical protein ENJ95_21400 [Bacteroidetes bacterium]|nr:hypothetical protein [Bacteroidota bacterium]